MYEDPPRVIFDCNVFLQALANEFSPARKVFALFEAGTITLFVSAAILREYREVSQRPEVRAKLPAITDLAVSAFLKKLAEQAVLIKNVPEEFYYPRDPKDEPYLNLAIVTNAAYLLSQDKDLLDLMNAPTEDAVRFRFRFPFLKIMKAADFLSEVAG